MLSFVPFSVLRLAGRLVIGGLGGGVAGTGSYVLYLVFTAEQQPYYKLAVERTRQDPHAMAALGGQLHPDKISIFNGMRWTKMEADKAEASLNWLRQTELR